MGPNPSVGGEQSNAVQDLGAGCGRLQEASGRASISVAAQTDTGEGV